MVGDHTHILRLPENADIMEKGHKEMEKILEMNIPLDLLLFLLEVLPEHLHRLVLLYILLMLKEK